MPRKRKSEPQWPPIPRRPPGTGSLQRLKDGRLRARLPASIDKRRPAKEFPAHALAEAQAWLDLALRRARGENVSGHTGATTLYDWSGYWHLTFVELIHPPNTAKSYLYALSKLATLYAMPLKMLRRSHLQAVVSELTKTLAPGTIQGIVSVWSRCLEDAVEDDLIPKNAAKRLDVPAAPKSGTQQRRHLTAREIGILWAAIGDEFFEPAFALMLGCGLRIGEILGLHWKNVDFAGKRIWVQDQFTNGHWRPMPKGHNPHWIPMPGRVAAALMRHREQQPLGTPLVMQSPHMGKKAKRDGKPRPWSRNTVATHLKKLVDRLKLEPMTPHATRHGLVTYLLDGNVPPSVVAERVGHANATITLQTYAHAGDDGRKRADELVAALLDGIPETPDPGPDGPH